MTTRRNACTSLLGIILLLLGLAITLDGTNRAIADPTLPPDCQYKYASSDTGPCYTDPVVSCSSATNEGRCTDLSITYWEIRQDFPLSCISYAERTDCILETNG
jgi:hypothetical protein